MLTLVVDNTKPKPVPVKTHIDRDEAIARLRAGLKKLSGRSWSVTGGRGTAWGWISVAPPPRRLVPTTWGGREASAEDTALLREVFGEGLTNNSYLSIPASSDYYRYYVALAEGTEPGTKPTPYWD